MVWKFEQTPFLRKRWGFCFLEWEIISASFFTRRGMGIFFSSYQIGIQGKLKRGWIEPVFQSREE